MFVCLAAAAPTEPDHDRPEIAHVRTTVAVHIVWLARRGSSITCRHVPHFEHYIPQGDRTVGVDVAPA
jgi:uncharacterized Zn-binding protein involved in type VI secretion